VGRGETREESRFLTVQTIAQQLDILIDAQQRLGVVIESIPNEEKPEIMVQQDGLICNCVNLSRKIDPTLALALAIQRKMWGSLDDVAQLFKTNPWCSSSELDYSFEQYASRRTGRDPITIYNWTRTAELWLMDGLGPKEEILLIDPKTGQVLLEQTNGETQPITRKWDPFFPDFTKLLLVNKTAQDGKLDDVGFGLLMNPETRWSDIRDYVHGLLPWERTPLEEDTSMGFFIQSGMLWVRKGDMSEVMGTLDLDNDNQLVREGIARMVRTFGITIVI